MRDRADLAAFLATLDSYLDFFCNRICGRAGTPLGVYGALKDAAAPSVTNPDTGDSQGHVGGKV